MLASAFYAAILSEFLREPPVRSELMRTVGTLDEVVTYGGRRRGGFYITVTDSYSGEKLSFPRRRAHLVTRPHEVELLFSGVGSEVEVLWRSKYGLFAALLGEKRVWGLNIGSQEAISFEERRDRALQMSAYWHRSFMYAIAVWVVVPVTIFAFGINRD